jgi:hypothetical protein
VTITGTGFSGTGFPNASAVDFGSAAAGFVVNSPTSITATAPAGTAGPVDITVTNLAGPSATNAADKYTYVAAPTVTAVTPAAGPLAGGTSVTITGTGFSGTGSPNASAVLFGSAVAVFNVNSSTSITATSPADLSAGPVDITVTTASATSATSTSDQFTYVNGPTVTTVTPAAGPLAGGTSVTITGTGFSGTGIPNASAVNFGTAAAVFNVNSSTSITATSPADLSAGPVDITVTTAGATSATSTSDQFTYMAAPTVTAVNPVAGLSVGFTSVTITGTGFTAVSAVRFGTTTGSFAVASATSITVTSPAGPVGTVDITVTTPGGTSSTSTADQFSYEQGPTVTAVGPTVGTAIGGTVVTITGTNLTGASSVMFGTTAAAHYAVVSSTSVTATSPADLAGGTVDITVNTPSGSSATSAADQFTFDPLPIVTSVSPRAGLPAGGSAVTITGANFTGASSVMFGTTAAAPYTVVSSTSLTATSPADLAGGTVDITVNTPGGTNATSPADQFIYEPAPAVTAIAPAAGPLVGGTSVTITGTNLGAASAVKFGSALAAITASSATSVTVTAPSGAAGTVDVTITTPSGTSTVSTADQYVYAPVPTVSGVSPLAGPLAGGTALAVTGTGFNSATAVMFGTTPAATYLVTSPTHMAVTSPAGTVGVVDVIVTTPGGTSATSAADGFTYVAAPAVTAVSPPSGPLAGGTTVTITGTGYSGVTAVKFGTATATYAVVSPTSITATSPAQLTGTVDVTVTNAGGPSATSAADQFSYAPAPVITSANPVSGPLAGAAQVTITGTSFAGATAVDFGATAATITASSATSVTATTPADLAGGTVDITVTTPSGTSTTSSADRYTYEGVPVVTAVSPVAGVPAGGSALGISGTSFTGATAVDFGTTPAVYSVVSSTSITATTPADPDGGTVDITVTTPSGTSATSSADHFTYEGDPRVTAVSPVAAPLAGGTTVTITGTGYTSATAVKFGAGAAAYSVVSSTSITATSPAETAGMVDITVTTPVGTSTTSSADHFTYEAVPRVTAVSPVAGVPGGGGTVSITGTNFTGASALDFGSAVTTSYSVVSSTSITASAPADPAGGTVDITVTTPSGTSATSAADQFTYEAAPVVTGLSPPVGLPAGGSTVVVTGTGFSGASAVDFGSVAAATYAVASGAQITATSPPELAGAVDVTVTTPLGTSPSSTSDVFTYQSGPTITALSPDAGLPAGATPVTITGTNFAGTTAVAFGSSPAATFLVTSPTSISATSPADLAGGPVAITVTTPSGTNVANPAAQYTYEAAPTVAAVSPGAGLPAGATQVTITGTNFTGTIAVEFGSSSTAIFSVTSPTSITATSPADLAAGTVDVTVHRHRAQPEGRLAGRGHARDHHRDRVQRRQRRRFRRRGRLLLHGRLADLGHRRPLPGRPGRRHGRRHRRNPGGHERHLCRRPVHLRGRAHRHRRQPGGRPAGRGHARDPYRDRVHRRQRGGLRWHCRRLVHGHVAHPDGRHLAGRPGRGHGRRHRRNPGGHERHQRAGRPVHLRGGPERHRREPGGRPAAGGDGRHHHRHRLHGRHRRQLRDGAGHHHRHLRHPGHRHGAGRRGGDGRRHRDHPGGDERHLRRRPVRLRDGPHDHRGEPGGRADGGEHHGHHHRDQLQRRHRRRLRREHRHQLRGHLRHRNYGRLPGRARRPGRHRRHQPGRDQRSELGRPVHL